MNARWIAIAALVVSIVVILPLAGLATEAELYFASDKNGENRVTKVREGDQVWIVVYDPDEDIDCDVRDKVWTDVKVIDVKTGAHIVWKSYLDKDGDAAGVKFDEVGYVPYKGHWPGTTGGYLGEDFLEEVDASTGLFVSRRPFQIGTRVDFGSDGSEHTHIVGPYDGKGPNVTPTDFMWGNFLYADSDDTDDDDHGDDRIWVGRAGEFILAQVGSEAPARDGVAYLPPGVDTTDPEEEDYMLGRFENMDTITGLYVDQNDPSDVALTQAKLNDTEATLSWSREIYKDGNEAATITLVDDDENLDCSEVEKVPIFVLINPGSWRNADVMSATDFCTLKRYGGVSDTAGTVLDQPIVWYTIYDSGIEALNLGSKQKTVDGVYYVQYPTTAPWDPAGTNGVTRVMFYASETSADSGIFEVRLNSILTDLGFNSLNVRDVLVAYYVDPNDQDDFKLATAYIEERNHSILNFTDGMRAEQEVFWIGRDPVYIEVIDANANEDACCPEQVVVHVCDPHEVDDVEWLVLDEMSSNSSIFFTNIGMRLVSVWDALGIGDPGANGGYSLQLDNWELEAFNEDSIYARYNDVVYVEADVDALGDTDTDPANGWFPPRIDHTRVVNDVSFNVFEVGDTQVFDGDETRMYFLDRNGNRVGAYANSDCVFVEVVDPDQDEDQNRRERIDGSWDGSAGIGQQLPFGPADFASNHDTCGYLETDVHPVNTLLGDTNIFDSGRWAKFYVLNPRTGRWAPVDLLETGIDTGTFVSVTCIDLVDRYDCVPTLGVLPGDTLIAAYQDPSNHSDVAWISIRVGIGGALVTGSTTEFVDVEGTPVAAYLVGEPLYVKVVDPSLVGAGSIPEALTIEGEVYDLAAYPDGGTGAFLAGPIDLVCDIGETVTATYVDPSDPSDTSSDTVKIVGGTLEVERFYAAPNPFEDVATFGYVGDGLAETFSVSIYDLSGRRIWSAFEENVLGITWDGVDDDGEAAANGAYIYVVRASGAGNTFDGKGTIFIRR